MEQLHSATFTSYMQMNVQIGSRAKTLDAGDSAGVGCAPFQSRLLEQKTRDDPVDDPQHRREQLAMGGDEDTAAGSATTAPIA